MKTGRCLMRFVRNVVRSVRFRLSRQRGGRLSAGIVLGKVGHSEEALTIITIITIVAGDLTGVGEILMLPARIVVKRRQCLLSRRRESRFFAGIVLGNLRIRDLDFRLTE